MRDGWIKIHRKLLDSRVFSDPELLRLWLFLLLNANFRTRPSFFRGGEVRRGETAYTHRQLADQLDCSRGKLGRDLEKLQSMGNITIKPGRDFSIATICNFERYQGSGSAAWDADGATNGAADGAASEATIGAASEAADGATLKKERTQEPPPPTPSKAFAPSLPAAEPGAWEGEEEVRDRLKAAGVSLVTAAIDGAKARGAAPRDVLALIDEWQSHAGAWDAGALFRRVTGELERWPRPAEAAARNAAHANQRSRDAAAAAAREAQRVADAAQDRLEKEEFQRLDAAHGIELDRMLGATVCEVEGLRQLFEDAFGTAWNIELQKFRNRRAMGEPMRDAQRRPLLDLLAAVSAGSRRGVGT